MNTNLEPTHKKRLVKIDSLRGIAAIAVMFFHYTIKFNPLDTNYIFHYGYLGVHLFFIISGFVIFMSIQGKTLAQFVKSRFLRLFPLYWIAIILSLILVFIAYKLNIFSPLGIPQVTFAQLNANWTMLQQWFDIIPINGVFWTLEVELSFYFIMGILIFTRRLNRVIQLSFFWSLVMIIGKFIFTTQFLVYFPFAQYGNLFIIGIVLYKYFNNGKLKVSEWILLITSILIQLLLSTPIEALAVVIFVTVFILIIKGYLNFLNNRILLWFGYISYALYLIHENLGMLIFNLFEKINIHSLIIRSGTSIILSVLIAYIMTELLEKPIVNFLKKLFIA